RHLVDQELHVGGVNDRVRRDGDTHEAHADDLGGGLLHELQVAAREIDGSARRLLRVVRAGGDADVQRRSARHGRSRRVRGGRRAAGGGEGGGRGGRRHA